MPHEMTTRRDLTGRVDGVTLTLSSSLDELTRRTAIGLTRRRFLRRGAEFAGALLAAGVAFNWDTRAALAHGYCSTLPCGPSPDCPIGDCSRGECYNGCYPRGAWEGFNCLSMGSTNNRWSECCNSGPNIGQWECVDCCCVGASGQNCSGCPNNNYYACLCRDYLSGTDPNCPNAACTYCNA